MADNTSQWEITHGLHRAAPEFVSDDIRKLLEILNFVILCGVISLLGIGANIVNITVFVKQGFQDCMNITFVGLAISDLGGLVTILWSSICYNPLFSGSDLPFQTMDVMYITSAWPHACFNKITSFITAFVTFERCICIAMPLKVKVIITPSRTKVIVLFIFVLLFALFSPLFYVNRLTWTFSPQRNATILAIRYSEEREAVETATFFVYSVAMSAFVIAFVFVCTLVLIIKLNSKAKWRLTSVANTAKQSQAVSVKDRKVVKMVALISTIFVICYIPTTLIFFMMAYEPQYSYGGRYENIYIVVWSVANVLETVNSSINFVVYYNMSSKFRLKFLEIFFRKDVG